MPPIVRKGLKSKQSRGFLGDARTAFMDGNSDLATELATKVFLVEGREAFGPSDKAMFEAMLARLEPPAGFRNWDAWMKSGANVPESTGIGASDDKKIETPLHDAAKEGDLAAVEKLIKAGADVNAISKQRDLNTTALFNAVTANHLDVAKRLLEANAKVDGKIDGKDLSPVILAAQSMAMAELILEKGGKLDAVDSYGRTLFTRVVDTFGKVPFAEYLAKKSPVMKDEHQRKVLERAMSQSSPELRSIAETFLARKR